ncbi:von Willebrand factor, type A [Nautilia profundicola AmH]|uniref:von Willebrand factor, type A n=1 Tax=Nautilia profundicola (strain ATCC BAA-1463 / DSM 18972 / AmH) TaxID=598659 RepID=B9L896_NAUPA|nr:VWA domain-containing protein [Nautilia profundicola]ACM92316.1 von Willebrand factor, type A [Nautilia profundicola AmH]
MSFEYPLFLIIPVLYLILKYFFSSEDDRIIFPNAHIFQKSKNRFSLLEFFIIFFLSVALASPVKSKIITNTHKKGYNIVIDLDTSGSMAEFNKIDAAKAVSLDFAKKRKNDALGLVVFGNIAYIASPLTFDKKTFEDILKRIYVSIAGGKTAIYDALFLSSNLFKNANGEKIIILLTDGMDNMSITPLDVVIKKLKKEHIKVYSIAIGGDADLSVLKKISKETNGKFYIASSLEDLKKIYSDINKLTKSNIKSNIQILNEYYFSYPLFLALILFLIYLYQYRKNIWNF